MKEVTTKNASSYITLVFFFKFFLKVFYLLFIFGCVGSLLLCMGFL